MSTRERDRRIERESWNPDRGRLKRPGKVILEHYNSADLTQLAAVLAERRPFPQR